MFSREVSERKIHCLQYKLQVKVSTVRKNRLLKIQISQNSQKKMNVFLIFLNLNKRRISQKPSNKVRKKTYFMKLEFYKCKYLHHLTIYSKGIYFSKIKVLENIFF